MPSLESHSGRSRSALAVLLAVFALVIGEFTAAIEPTSNEDLAAMRSLFRDAQSDISAKRYTAARDKLTELQANQYPLAPYLEMSLLIANIYREPDAKIDAFLSRYEGYWLGEKLRLNWLNVLKSRKRYQDYVDHFVVGTGNTVQRCFYGEALVRVGRQQEAWDLVKPLWLIGRSQNDACDYVFDQWRKSSDFSDEYYWQRFLLARNAGQTRFSGYLERQVKDDAIALRIDAYHAVRQNSSLIAKSETFVTGGVAYSAVIGLGLRNYANRDLDAAIAALKRYTEHPVLEPSDLNRALNPMLEALQEAGRQDEAITLAETYAPYLELDTVNDAFNRSLLLGDWNQTLDWIELVPESERQQDKWYYWHGRAMNELGLSGSTFYGHINQNRSYYGFLAAYLTDQPFGLSHQTTDYPDSWQPDANTLSAMIRAKELFAVNYNINARLTWENLQQHLNNTDQQRAGVWAHQHGLHFFAIRSMITAQSWDDTDVRFPTAYLEVYEKNAAASGIPISWMYAISRQESSFEPTITSSAGARGLMQLMPGTAQDMARKVDLRYAADKLTDPEFNTRVGAAYLDEGLDQLHNNAVYATAGYNAGINRVRGWLRERDQTLPLDIWIENIPFNETQNYVKNVVANSVIYGSKLEQDSIIELLESRFFAPLNR